MLVQDLVVWRTKFQDRPVQVPRVRRRKDPHIASPSGVLFPVQETEILTFYHGGTVGVSLRSGH